MNTLFYINVMHKLHQMLHNVFHGQCQFSLTTLKNFPTLCIFHEINSIPVGDHLVGVMFVESTKIIQNAIYMSFVI